MKTVLTVWALYALLIIAFWATVIYVAVHFIAKVW